MIPACSAGIANVVYAGRVATTESRVQQCLMKARWAWWLRATGSGRKQCVIRAELAGSPKRVNKRSRGGRTQAIGETSATVQFDPLQRADDAMDYTADVVTEIAVRLARGEAPVGAYTPAEAFGADLATAAGGAFRLDR